MGANITDMTWWQYVNHIAGGATQEAIARKASISAPTVTRWRTSTPRPENVAAFARAYGRPVLEAFVAAGFLTSDEAQFQVMTHKYDQPTDDELLDLIERRLHHDREAGEPGGDTAPIDQAAGSAAARVTDEDVEDLAPGPAADDPSPKQHPRRKHRD